jgi:hypothetical protein
MPMEEIAPVAADGDASPQLGFLEQVWGCGVEARPMHTHCRDGTGARVRNNSRLRENSRPVARVEDCRASPRWEFGVESFEGEVEGEGLMRCRRSGSGRERGLAGG